MNYPRYPEYKPSGVEWLGEVPAHWTETRLKNAASIRVSNVDKKAVEGQEPVRLCNYVDVYYHDRITPDLEFMEATATPQQIEKFALKKNDVLITKDSETSDDIAIPSFVGSDLEDVVCGYHLALIRPEVSVVDGAYLARSLAALGIRDQFHSSANGITRFGLSVGDISCTSILVPSLKEQRTIAVFLDRETARIDVLIGKKQRFIDLLQEKRAALISRAVTRGLDPNVPLKDSGVEWLGQIPAHWEVKRLSQVCASLQTGPFGSQLHASDYIDDGIPLINPANINDGRFIPDSQCTVDEATAKRLSRHVLEAGDLVFGRRGEMGRCGLTRLAEKGWLCGTGCLRARPKLEIVDPEFLNTYFRLRGVAEHLSLVSVGSTMENLNTSILGRTPIAVAPVVEQKQIVEAIHADVIKIDSLASMTESAIDKLKEYRAAFIAATVTGKIDVREA